MLFHVRRPLYLYSWLARSRVPPYVKADWSLETIHVANVVTIGHNVMHKDDSDAVVKYRRNWAILRTEQCHDRSHNGNSR